MVSNVVNLHPYILESCGKYCDVLLQVAQVGLTGYFHFAQEKFSKPLFLELSITQSPEMEISGRP